MFDKYDSDNKEELRERLLRILENQNLDEDEAKECLKIMFDTMKNYYGDVVSNLIDE
jgi:hypothetical protein